MTNELFTLRCPICHHKTHTKIRKDSELKNFPLFCPKCKGQTLINVKNLNLSILINEPEPDAKTQSR